MTETFGLRLKINKNTSQMINVREIFKMFSPTFINALPAWYFFTGCRYEPSFYGKGRKTCLKVLEKNVGFQAAFGSMSSNLGHPKEDVLAVLEEFTCHLYNSKAKDVNFRRQYFSNCIWFEEWGLSC